MPRTFAIAAPILLTIMLGISLSGCAGSDLADPLALSPTAEAPDTPDTGLEDPLPGLERGEALASSTTEPTPSVVSPPDPSPAPATERPEPEDAPETSPGGEPPEPAASDGRSRYRLSSPADIPPIPQSREPRWVTVDQDYTYARVGDEVITAGDIQKDLAGFLDRLERAGRVQDPFDPRMVDDISRAEQNAIYQKFRNQLLEVLYRQEGEALRQLLGSVPESAVEEYVQNARRSVGVRGDTEADNQLWREHLRQINMTPETFRQRVINQIERQRVQYLMAYHPDYQLGLSIDVTPEQMWQEYVRQPIVQTRNCRLYRVEFPILSDDQHDEVFQRAYQFYREVEQRLGRANLEPEERAAEFVAIAQVEVRGFSGEPELLPTLEDEDPEIAAQIRRTAVAELSSPIPLDEKIVILYLIDKEQGGLEPFASPGVQSELRQRIETRMWNDLRARVDQELIRRAVILPNEIIDQRR